MKTECTTDSWEKNMPKYVRKRPKMCEECGAHNFVSKYFFGLFWFFWKRVCSFWINCPRFFFVCLHYSITCDPHFPLHYEQRRMFPAHGAPHSETQLPESEPTTDAAAPVWCAPPQMGILNPQLWHCRGPIVFLKMFHDWGRFKRHVFKLI